MSKKADELSMIMELHEQLSDAYRENAELQRRLTALAQSDAERIRELEAECGRFENALFEARAALAQSDAEPVAWRYKYKGERGSDDPGDWFLADKQEIENLPGEQIDFEPLYAAPPRPDASAGLIEAAEQARDSLNGRHNVGSDAYKAFCILNAAISRARAADRSGK